MSLQLAVLILAGGLTICGGVGLAALLLWMPARRQMHYWLVGSGIALAVWAYCALARHIPALSPTTPARTGYLMLSAMALAPVCFYAFVRRLQPPVDIYARGLVVWTRLYAVAVLVIIWGGKAARIPADWGDHGYDLRLLGVIGLVHAAIYGLIPFLLLRLKLARDTGLLGPAGLMLALGVSANLVPALRGTPVDLVLIAAAVVLMDYTVVRGQLLSPLLTKNAQLERTITDLRGSLSDLAVEKNEAVQIASELHDANRSKNEFLTNMSHALRTPLNSIVGYSELLLNGIYGELSERQLDRLDKIHRNSDDLLALLNDSLDLIRIEGGRLELDVETLRMADVIAAAREAVLSGAQGEGGTAGAVGEAGEVGTQIEVELAAPLRLVRGDAARVRQVIQNLLTYAVQQTPHGVVRLRAQNVTVRDGHTEDAVLPTRGWLEDRYWLLISVEDGGPGIPPQEQALIFDAFRHAGDPARQESTVAHGLGLAVAKRLVEMHSGRIWVRSVPTPDAPARPGSTILVALPAQPAFDKGT